MEMIAGETACLGVYIGVSSYNKYMSCKFKRLSLPREQDGDTLNQDLVGHLWHPSKSTSDVTFLIILCPYSPEWNRLLYLPYFHDVSLHMEPTEI